MLDYHTIKDNGFQRLSGGDRRNIERLLFSGNSKSHIARYICKHRSTVTREVNNMANWDFVKYGNKVRRSYCARLAQANYEKAKLNCGAKLKFVKFQEQLSLIENQFFETKYPPDAIAGALKDKGVPVSITGRTIYNYIEKGISRIKPHDLLRKIGRKRVKKRQIRQNKRKLGKSIDLRPERINNRSEFGHFEADSIVDKLDNAILVCIERISRKCILRKLEKHESKEVLEKMEKLKAAFRMKSVTADNGSEFYRIHQLEDESFDVYFTHPYSSWEKGSVENLNSIIRRYIPKGSNLSYLTEETITRIQEQINNLPRKIHNYKTANEMFDILSAA